MLSDYAFERIEGLDIHYRRSGRAEAPKLLLTGAWPQSIHCWDASWPLLCEHFSVLALDLPGFGCSQGPSEWMRPSRQGMFVRNVLAYFGHEGAYAVMPDVGVPVGLWLLENEPLLLQGAIFANGPCAYPLLGSAGLRALAASRGARLALGASSHAFVRVALYGGYRAFRPSPELLAKYVDCYRGDRLATTLSYLASYARELPAIQRALPTIRAPVTMLWGRRDPFLSEENAHVLARSVPRCTVEMLDGIGHFSHEEAPARFVHAALRQVQLVEGVTASSTPPAETRVRIDVSGRA